MTPAAHLLGKIIGRNNHPGFEANPIADTHIISEIDVEGASKAPAESLSTMLLPTNPATIFLGGLFILAAFTVLHIARAIILPVVLAFIFKLLLQPAMRFLERLHLPRTVGALIIILLLMSGIIGFGRAFSGPAEIWITKLPEGLPRLVEHLRFLRTPLDALERILDQAEQFAAGTATSGATRAAQSGFAGTLFGDARAFAEELFTTALVLFFLLVSGDTFLRRFVEILPKFHDKRKAVDISQQVERDISGYLLTITAMNAAVGVAAAIAMYVSGLGDPLLWGAVAFLLNYVPILGPLTGAVIFILAGLLSFDSLWRAFLPVTLYLVVHVIEGEIVTPMLLARRFTLNPVLVILSLIFWFWMWGVPGAILSVPMLAIAKIICDRVRPLMALGHFLEG